MLTWDHVTSWQHYISTTTMLISTKVGSVMTYRQRLPIIKLHDPLITWSCEITWQIKNVVSSAPQCMRPTNLAMLWHRMRVFLFIKSHDHLNKWLCEVTWIIKNIAFPLSQCLWSENLSRCWHTTRFSHP